jgi:hypothetical protein
MERKEGRAPPDYGRKAKRDGKRFREKRPSYFVALKNTLN